MLLIQIYLFIITFFLLFFNHTNLSAFAMLNPIDFLALQTIRTSLNDMPASNYFSSWDFTSDPCNFPGVYCSGNKVISLNLGDPTASSPGLTGRLHSAIGKLSALTELTIIPGRITGPLPPTISCLKYLRFLALSRNLLTGEIPASLAQLRELQTLDLSYNQLSGRIPYPVGSMPALSNVILSHNRLSGEVPPLLSETLTRLDLKHNELSGSLSHNSLPSSLQYLSLSLNRFTGPVDRVLSQLNRLNYLDLSLNLFNGNIPGVIFTFPLTNLQLQRNSFSGKLQSPSPVNIPTVDLSYNELSGEISPSFSTVQILYLNNNRFIGRVPGVFVDRLMDSGIQILYLQHNYLTGLDIKAAGEIPVSSSLCVQYNCMVLPLQAPCPFKAGKQKIRPSSQCEQWKG